MQFFFLILYKCCYYKIGNHKQSLQDNYNDAYYIFKIINSKFYFYDWKEMNLLFEVLSFEIVSIFSKGNLYLENFCYRLLLCLCVIQNFVWDKSNQKFLHFKVLKECKDDKVTIKKVALNLLKVPLWFDQTTRFFYGHEIADNLIP